MISSWAVLVGEVEEEIFWTRRRRYGNNKPHKVNETHADLFQWLAITHKSHSHGRLGFNDRLAYLGKRIVDLQTSLALLSSPSPPLTSAFDPNHVYSHPSLEGLENISVQNKMQALDKVRMAKLAGMYGLDGVVRWKPKKSDNLEGSGVNTVLAHTIYSIVGAVAMQKGGEVAARVARERVLQPLGLR